MNRSMERRLARLEHASRPYASYLGRSAAEWPDLALTAFVCECLGQPPRALTDDELRATIDMPEH